MHPLNKLSFRMRIVEYYFKYRDNNNTSKLNYGFMVKLHTSDIRMTYEYIPVAYG